MGELPPDASAALRRIESAPTETRLAAIGAVARQVQGFTWTPSLHAAIVESASRIGLATADIEAAWDEAAYGAARGPRHEAVRAAPNAALSPRVTPSDVEPTDQSEPNSRTPLPWRPLRQVESDAKAKPRDWEWFGFLALRTVAVISGEPKGGKSEVLAAFLAVKTRGGDWLGRAVTLGRVVLVTEEGDHDIVEKLARYEADFDAVVVLSRDAVATPPTWGSLVASAVEKAVAFDAGILVIDTFSFWAAIEGDGERVEGVIREALQALQLARNTGLATILVHHTVKTKDVEGIAALRGSGAFAASVESVGIFRRCSTKAEDGRRRLSVFSRIAPCTTLTIERVLPGDGGVPHFRTVDASAGKASASDSADGRIINAVTTMGGWVERRALTEATALSVRTLESRLPAIVEKGRLIRTGRGVPNDAFRYAKPGTRLPIGVEPSAEPKPSPRPRRAASSSITEAPRTSAKRPHYGGRAVADPPITEAPHPPMGVRDGVVVERIEDSERTGASPQCGDSTDPPVDSPGHGPTPSNVLFETKPDARAERRLRDEGGRS